MRGGTPLRRRWLGSLLADRQPGRMVVQADLDETPGELATHLRRQLADGPTGTASIADTLERLADTTPVVLLVTAQHGLSDADAATIRSIAARTHARDVTIIITCTAHQADQLVDAGFALADVEHELTAACIDLLATQVGLVDAQVVDELLTQLGDELDVLVPLVRALDQGHREGWIALPEPLPAMATTIIGPPPPDDARQLALALVALSRIASRPVLDDAADRLDIDLDPLGATVTGGILARDGDTLRVTSATMRATLAAAVGPPRRQAIHAALAAAVERHHPAEFVVAARHRTAAGAAPIGELIEALTAAAEQARERSELQSAARCVAELASLLGPGDRRASAYLEAAEIAWQAGRSDWTASLLTRARADIAVGPAPHRLQVLATRLQASRPGAVDLLGELASATAGSADQAAAADQCTVLAMIAVMSGRLELGREAARAARDRAAGDQRRTVIADTWLAGIELLTAPDRSAAEHVDQAATELQAVLVDGGDLAPPPGPESVVTAACWALLNRLARDELDIVRIGARDLVGQLSAAGRHGLLPLPLGVLALAEFRRGWWQAASEHARRAVELADGSDQPATAANGHLVLAWIGAARGDAALVDEHLARVRAVVELAGVELLAGYVHAIEGLLALSVASPSRAVAQLELARRVVRSQGVVEPRFLASDGDLLEAHIGLSDQPAVEALTSRLRSEGAEAGWLAGVLARADGALEADAPSAAMQDAHLERSCAVFAEIAMPFEEARSRLLWAELAARRGDGRIALREADRAQGLFGVLGAEPWVTRAEAVRRRVGVQLETEDRWLLLTPQERRIASLVADGRANREVAVALNLSTKTIEYHLHHIFVKLDVGNRTQLAGLLAGRPNEWI